MAGVGVSVDVQDRELGQLLARLHRQSADLSEPFADIGEYLLQAHDDRFAAQESPDGTPWAPLSPGYLARKPKNQDKILVLDGILADTLGYNADPTELTFGTNRIYGATHHFGDPERGIPERPWLGLSDDDQAEVLDILSDHLADG
jgi:phage virion morphogenesis protein